MNTPSKKIRPYPGGCFLLAGLVLLLSGSASHTTRIPERSITLPAASQPEFKTDPHVKESQGNQISGIVRVMLQDTRGRLWFGTQDGVARYDGRSLVYFDIRDVHDQPVAVHSIVEDAQGDLWFGTTGGITRYDGEFFTNYTEKDGLPSDDVWCVYVDSRGLLWVGTIDGVCRFDGEAFSLFSLPAGQKNPHVGVSSPTMVRWITEDRAGNMWFAAEGRVYKFDGVALETISLMDQKSATYVRCILEDQSGNMWFATQENGVVSFDGDTFTSVTETEELSGKSAGHLFEDSEGNIWFTVDFGVWRYDGTSATNITRRTDGVGPATFSIAEDDEGRMWFVGLMGAYRYEGHSLVNVTRDGPW